MTTATRVRRGALLLERLDETVLVADGAMGTMLYGSGVFINQSFDQLSLTRPDLVARIHREYVAAGADLIETNTFGANRARLTDHGLEDRLEEINRASVQLARESATDGVFVAGSVGPIGLRGQVAGGYGPDDLRAIYSEQLEVLLEAGVDALVLETVPTLIEMEAAIAAARSLDGETPLIALMTFNEDGVVQSGEGPGVVAERLARAGADVVGANCSVGPKPMLDCVVAMGHAGRSFLAAMPNAGLPESVEGRLIYMADPEYLGKYAKRFVKAGVRLLGGCCGTTPAHVRRMKREVAGFVPERRERAVSAVPAGASSAPVVDIRSAERTALASALAADRRFVTSVELTPPKSADLADLLEGVRRLGDAGVVAVNIPEYARLSPRPTPLAIARVVKDAVAIETIIHYCCRDRNLYGMQADLLSARALDIRDVLIITGDPPKAGEYAVPTAVFDVDSIGLTRVAAGLNRGVDAAGQVTGVPLGLHLGVGVNPGALDLEREVERFRKKVEAGTEFAMTQPVFEAGHLERFFEALGPIDIPILAGILPLYSHRNAEFLHNEIPGMNIPEPIRSRMRKTTDGDAARREGVAIAREALAAVGDFPAVRGAYVMPPFGRYDMALAVLEDVL